MWTVNSVETSGCVSSLEASGWQRAGSTLSEAASFCARHGLEAPLDELCNRAVLELSQGYIQTAEALKVAESALTIHNAGVNGDCPDNQLKGKEKLVQHGTISLFSTLQGIAARVPVGLELSDLKTLTVVLLHWSLLQTGLYEASGARAAFGGLVVAAAPILARASAPADEAVAMAHALARGMDHFQLEAGSAESGAIEEALKVALAQVRRQLHKLGTGQIAQLAGTVASAWKSVSVEMREEVLRPCCKDVGQAVRFRRAAFGAGELITVVAAMDKVEVPADAVATVLHERISSDATSFSNEDLVNLVSTCSNERWSQQPITALAVAEAKKRNLSEMSSQELCTMAHSMASLRDQGVVGVEACELMASIAETAQGTEFSGFALVDRIQLLHALAVVVTQNGSTCSLLVQQIQLDSWTDLQHDTAVSLLCALSSLWQQLQPLCSRSEYQIKLFNRVCALSPWTSASPGEMISIVDALSKLPTLEDSATQDSLSNATARINAASVSKHELAAVLIVLSHCGCKDAARVAAGVLMSFATEAKKRLVSLSEASSTSELEALAFALIKTGAAEEAHVKFCASCCGAHCSHEKQVGEMKIERYHHGYSGHGDHDECHGHESDCTWCELEERDLPLSEYAGLGHHHPPPHHEVMGIMKESYDHGHHHAHRGSGDKAIHDLACDNEKCCPTATDPVDGVQLRLNRHCGFAGHCVQIKNTFIHIECSNDDSDDSDHDCVVCRRLGRSRSFDAFE